MSILLVLGILWCMGCQPKTKNTSETISEVLENLQTPNHLDLIQSLQVQNQPGMQWLEREQSFFKESPHGKTLAADEVYWEMRVYDSPESQESVNSKGYFYKEPDIYFATDASREWVEAEERPYLYGRLLHLMDSLGEKMEETKASKEDEDLYVFEGTFTPEELQAVEGMGDYFDYLSEEDALVIRFECARTEGEKNFHLQHMIITGKKGEDPFSLKEAIFKDGGHKGLGKLLPPSLVKVIIKNGHMIDEK